jgi:hypothetical protein
VGLLTASHLDRNNFRIEGQTVCLFVGRMFVRVVGRSVNFLGPSVRVISEKPLIFPPLNRKHCSLQKESVAGPSPRIARINAPRVKPNATEASAQHARTKRIFCNIQPPQKKKKAATVRVPALSSYRLRCASVAFPLQTRSLKLFFLPRDCFLNDLTDFLFVAFEHDVRWNVHRCSERTLKKISVRVVPESGLHPNHFNPEVTTKKFKEQFFCLALV